MKASMILSSVVLACSLQAMAEQQTTGLDKAQAAIVAFNLGAQRHEEGDLAGARASFQEAVRIQPDLPEPYLGLADVYYNEGNLPAAVAAIDRYLGLRQSDADGLLLAYLIYRDAGDSAGADRAVSALAGTDQGRSLAAHVYNEGAVAVKQGDYETAVTCFRRAAVLDPNLAAAHSSEATILYRSARYDEARAALVRLFRVEPRNIQGRRIDYLIFDALGDAAGAADALEAYIALDRDGALQDMYQRAERDFHGGNVSSAIAALERIIALRPDMARAHYTLGIYYVSTDATRARRHLQIFLELSPDDPEAQTAREMLSHL